MGAPFPFTGAIVDGVVGRRFVRCMRRNWPFLASLCVLAQPFQQQAQWWHSQQVEAEARGSGRHVIRPTGHACSLLPSVFAASASVCCQCRHLACGLEGRRQRCKEEARDLARQRCRALAQSTAPSQAHWPPRQKVGWTGASGMPDHVPPTPHASASACCRCHHPPAAWMADLVVTVGCEPQNAPAKGVAGATAA